MIPKIIHQIWIQGCNKLPEKHKKYSDKWKQQKGYQYICWNDITIKNLIIKHDKELLKIYNYFDLLQQKSDLARYLILYIYGGIYIDMDIEPGNLSIDKLLELNKDMIFAKGGSTEASQNFILTKKENIFFYDLINHIKKNYKKQFYDLFVVLYVNRSTGGLIFQSLLNKYKNDYVIIPDNLVYRCESIDDCKIEKDLVALLHFEKSWNIYLYILRFIEYYKKVILSTSIFLLYLIFSDCKSISIDYLCKLKFTLNYIVILTFMCLILNYMVYKKISRNCIIYLILLFLSIYSLSNKCYTCNL